METDKIRKLLDKYWEGETSIQEESELQSYFASSHIAEDLLPFQPLFAFYDKKKHVMMDRDVSIPPANSENKAGGNVRSLRWMLQVAASVLILISLFFLKEKTEKAATKQELVLVDTYEDPELAYQEVKQALMFLSTKMNKGVKKTSNSLTKMEPLDDILN